MFGSGTRLQLVRYQSADGLSAATGLFYDSQLGARCSAAEVNGVTYCLPGSFMFPTGVSCLGGDVCRNSTPYFGDSACTQPISAVWLRCAGIAWPKYVYDLSAPSTCGAPQQLTVYAVAPAPAPALYWQVNGCSLVPLPGFEVRALTIVPTTSLAVLTLSP